MTAPPKKPWKKTGSHALERAKERLGMELSQDDIRQIKRDIRDNVAVFSHHCPGYVEAWDCLVKGRLVRVIWDPVTRVVCTVAAPKPWYVW